MCRNKTPALALAMVAPRTTRSCPLPISCRRGRETLQQFLAAWGRGLFGQAMSDVWTTLQPYLVEYGGRAVAAVVLLAAGWVGIRLVVRLLRGVLARTGQEALATSFLLNSLRTILWFAVLLAI